MGMPHESSIFCETCSSFNLQSGDCIIIDGEAFCDDCLEDKFKVKKNFDEIKKRIQKERKR